MECWKDGTMAVSVVGADGASSGIPVRKKRNEKQGRGKREKRGFLWKKR